MRLTGCQRARFELLASQMPRWQLQSGMRRVRLFLHSSHSMTVRESTKGGLLLSRLVQVLVRTRQELINRDDWVMTTRNNFLTFSLSIGHYRLA